MMRVFILLFALIGGTGCATTTDSKCPELPLLQQGATQAEVVAHHTKVITMYAECAKGK